MWIYKQLTGELSHDAALVGVGYSGHGEGRNNPAMEAVPNVGPIPQGFYSISAPFDTPTHGPHVMRLTPAAGQDEHGRDGFLMHGDNAKHDASQGCIIMGPAIRNQVSSSGDTQLQVVP